MPDAAVVRPRDPTVAQSPPRQDRQPTAARPTSRRDLGSLIPLFAPERIDAVRGRPVVVPLTLPRTPAPAPTLELRLDDGRRVDASVVWIGAEPSPVAQRSWLEPAGLWAAFAPPKTPPPTSAGAWHAIFRLPDEVGRAGLWARGVRTPINVIIDPATLAAAPAPGAWPPMAGNAAPDLLLNQLMQPDRQSPWRRWRYRLMFDGLAPDPPLHRTPDHLDPIDALAQQQEARWQVALAWLASSHGPLSIRLRQRLAHPLDLGLGAEPRFAPVLGGSDLELERLLADLLDPYLSPPDRALRAQSFIDAQPTTLAWVVDDAGRRDAATGLPIASLGVANLSARPIVASCTAAGARRPTPLAGSSANAGPAPDPTPQIVPVSPWASQRVTSPGLPVIERAGRPSPVIVRVEVGAWSRELDVIAAPLPALPPGLALQPFSHDWTLDAWIAGRPDERLAPETGWSTLGLVYHDPAPSAGPPGWRVLIESHAADAGHATEHVELWFGPSGTPAAVWRIAADGSVAAIRGPTPSPDAISISTADRRWTAVAALPSSLIDPQGELRLGVIRVDARGTRAAWPRPMLPWQIEPARLRIDTRRWDVVGPRTTPPPVGPPR